MPQKFCLIKPFLLPDFEPYLLSQDITDFLFSNFPIHFLYNYTLLEASMEYIMSLRDLKELVKDEVKELKDARKSLAGITNHRLSLLS